jgi:hypothetical protein
MLILLERYKIILSGFAMLAMLALLYILATESIELNQLLW